MAKRDAAFEAYKALYDGGLIDDHLLPLGHAEEAIDEAYSAVEKRPSLVEVNRQLDPWVSVARQWQLPHKIQASVVKILEGGIVCAEMMVLLPCTLPSVTAFDLYWSPNTSLEAVVEEHTMCLEHAVLASAMQITTYLLRSVFQGRVESRDDLTALFVPCDTPDLGAWVQKFSSAVKANDMGQSDIRNEVGLIRDITNNRVPYVLRDVIHVSAEDIPTNDAMDVDEAGVKAELYSEDQKIERILREKIRSNGATRIDRGDEIDGVTLLEVTKLPKKIDFLHHSPAQDLKIEHGSKPNRLLAQDCEMDRLPYRYSQFAMFIPSILHRIQVAMVVDHLCKGLLAPLQFKDRNLVTTAISASSANEGTDYQRLEFFGDSMLKYITSLTLIAGHLNWHEGILSHKKDHIVSNSSLASAALKTGLDEYILTKAFTGRKWRPLYNSLILQDQLESKREMSSKTLADVVEALIGAAYLDGGSQKALACLKVFLPDIAWTAPSEACRILYQVHDLQIPSAAHIVQVERLISYQFSSKALLVEALTHGSHRGPSSGSSYQRLEFLGDAVLDNIVTRTAFRHEPPIPTHKLHLIRTALVNGNFLGFLCLNHYLPQTRIDPVTDDPKNISTIEIVHPFHLWQAMRHASPTVSFAQQECILRYQTLHTTITELLTNGNHYPWTALARLEPPKPMSDIVESLVGAIYIDTQGSLPACEAFLERLGLISYLRRAMEGNVALLHPKEELGQLAERDKVQYELGKVGEEAKQRLTCTVLVGEREIVRVEDGLSTIEVQTRAAEEACRVMKEMEVDTCGQVDDADSQAAEKHQGELEGDSDGEEEQGEESEGERGPESDSDVYMTADE